MRRPISLHVADDTPILRDSDPRLDLERWLAGLPVVEEETGHTIAFDASRGATPMRRPFALAVRPHLVVLSPSVRFRELEFQFLLTHSLLDG